MTRRSCDGAGLLAAFRAAVANLEAHVDEINELNVFPVPDGDTGSNMAATVRVALEEAERVAGEPADRIAAAISFGALMGARGNSGVITSQILNGMARGLERKRRFNGLDLAHCLALGTETAYAAVKKPVEGTILTVIREASAAAAAAERDDDDRDRPGGHGRRGREGRRQDAEPPADPARGRRGRLRRAGPLPAVPGALRFVVGEAVAGGVSARVHERAKPSAWSPTPTRASATRRCSCCSRARPRPRYRRYPDPPRDDRRIGRRRGRRQGGQGPRPQRAPGRDHRLRAGLGSLSRISVENLDNQARDVRETGSDSPTAAVRPRRAPPGRPPGGGLTGRP